MEFSTFSKIKRYRRQGLFAVIGSVIGFGYYYFIGCASGTCPITSNPWITTAYGMLAGWVLAPLSKQQSTVSEKQE